MFLTALYIPSLLSLKIRKHWPTRRIFYFEISLFCSDFRNWLVSHYSLFGLKRYQLWEGMFPASKGKDGVIQHRYDYVLCFDFHAHWKFWTCPL